VYNSIKDKIDITLEVDFEKAKQIGQEFPDFI